MEHTIVSASKLPLNIRVIPCPKAPLSLVRRIRHAAAERPDAAAILLEILVVIAVLVEVHLHAAGDAGEEVPRGRAPRRARAVGLFAPGRVAVLRHHIDDVDVAAGDGRVPAEAGNLGFHQPEVDGCGGRGEEGECEGNGGEELHFWWWVGRRC